jgi:hypothetical protein
MNATEFTKRAMGISQMLVSAERNTRPRKLLSSRWLARLDFVLA